jgi:uncharacterized protein (TIGR03905 family)
MASKTGIGCGDPRQGPEKQGPPSGLKGSERRILLKPDHEAERFVYQTKGVCPPEIHFQIQGDLLKEIRFIGGGCPGNAKLVSRMLRGRPVSEVLPLLKDIPCRNDTSCPDQLVKALTAALKGSLNPARSFLLYTDPQPRSRLGLIGELGGRSDVLKRLIRHMRKEQVEVIYSLGNLTGNLPSNEEVIKLVRKEGILTIQGDLDWRYGQDEEPGGLSPLPLEERDHLFQFPQVLAFQVGDKKGMAFYGRYLQELPGFSDFEPFALEINMVCNLTNFLQDESVFPALEAMVPQFETQVIIFSQIKKWGHRQIGGVDFISLGPAWDGNGLRWGLLEGRGREIYFKVMGKQSLKGG